MIGGVFVVLVGIAAGLYAPDEESLLGWSPAEEPGVEIPVSRLSLPPPGIRAELAPLGRMVYQTGTSGFLIAMMGTGGETSEIYSVAADGRGRRLLTPPAGAGIDVDQAWSPDGKRIAFASWRHGDADIHVMNGDGTGVERLTTLPGDEISPRWSRDGRRIAFLAGVDNDYADLWVMKADGTAPELWLSRSRRAADWGLDGRIASINEAGELVLLGPASADVVLTRAGAINNHVAWSPDGTTILFNLGGLSYDLVAVPADGSAPAKRFPAGGDNPVWSPDGSRVALSEEGCCALVVARADGTGLRKLVDWADPGDWSPDGQFVAYIDLFGPGDTNAVAVVPAAGGAAYRITPYLDEEMIAIDWQPR